MTHLDRKRLKPNKTIILDQGADLFVELCETRRRLVQKI